MANDIWSFASLNRPRFAAAALAVACTQKQQDIEAPNAARDDDDSDDDVSDSDSIRPRDLVRSSGKEVLQQKFLNRLAEIFAKQKTPHDRRSARNTAIADADHAAATVLVFEADDLVVYVAKNAGLDDEDKKMLSDLQRWMRALALSGHRRPAEDDILWCRLMEFNRLRIKFYVRELAKVKDRGKCDAVVALRHSCETYVSCASKSPEDLMIIISKAYNLRYSMQSNTPRKVVKFIGMLGRLRAAWETLQEYAMHNVACKRIQLRDVPTSEPVKIPNKQIKQELEKLRRGLSSEVEIRKELEHFKTLKLYTHAEIQLLLLSGEAKTRSKELEFVPYIGSSKKTCWLCEQMLRGHGYFRSRGTHGKVSAHWTVQPNSNLEAQSLFTIKGSLCHIQEILSVRALTPLPKQRPAVAESTAAITSSKSAATVAKMKRRRQGHKQSAQTRNEATENDERPLEIFGKRLNDIRAIRLPSDAITPDAVLLRVHEKECKAHKMGPGSTVLDFRPFWGEFLHIEQDHQMWRLENQKNSANEGEYLVFYSLHEGLRRNNCIAGVLGIIDVGSIADHRLFWRGDVFIVRFQDVSSTGGTYLSLLVDAEMSGPIEVYLRDAWERKSLEELRDSARGVEEFGEKTQRDLDLVRARLYVAVSRNDH